jgi:hypothetical protein
MNIRQFIIGAAAVAIGIGAYAEDKKISALPAASSADLSDSVILSDAADSNATKRALTSTVYQGIGSKLRRSSDGAYETAQYSTEYYSPNQYGGIYGTVYRRYFTLAGISDGGSVSCALGGSGYLMIYIRGFVKDGSTYYTIPEGPNDTGTNVDLQAYITGSTLRIDANSGRSWDSGMVWIDYAK